MRIFHVDSFTAERFSGNPATVILDAEDQSENRLAAIAHEFAPAETAFIFASSAPDHDIAIRFFSARKEIAFVGHATIAAHQVLLTLGRRGFGALRQKTQHGIMPVTAHRPSASGAPSVIEFRQTAAALDPPLALKDSLRIAHALGLPGELVHETMPAKLARLASTRLLLPIGSPLSLSRVTPHHETLLELSQEFGADGFFAFALERTGQTVITHSRMFCPALGIPEDPVSGNAHAMLATYLWEHPELRPGLSQFVGRQGEHMGRAGEVSIRLETNGDALVAAHIGGNAVIISEGRLV